MKLILAFVSLMFVFQANSSQLSDPNTIEFYQKLLSCREITLKCLKSKGLIQQLTPLLYSVKGSSEAYFHELDTAIRLSSLLNLRVLFCPHLPGFNGIPAVDAIVFANDGRAIANVSLKTKREASNNITKSLKGLIQTTRASIREIYNRQAFYEIFNVDYSEQKPNEPHLDYHSRKLRPLAADATLKFLGLHEDHLEKPRPIWIAIDIREDESKAIELHGSDSDSFPIRSAKLYMVIRDGKSAIYPAQEDLIDVSKLQDRFANIREPDRLLMMVNRSYISIEAKEVRQGSFKIHQDICASFLGAYNLEALGE